MNDLASEDLQQGLHQLWEDFGGRSGWLQAFTVTSDKAARKKSTTASGEPLKVGFLEMDFELDDPREIEAGDKKLVILTTASTAEAGDPSPQILTGLSGVDLDKSWTFRETPTGQEFPLVGPLVAQRPGAEVLWWEGQLKRGGGG